MRKSAIIVIIVLTTIAIGIYCLFGLPGKPKGQENCERIKRQIKLSIQYKNIYDYPCVVSLKVPLLNDQKYNRFKSNLLNNEDILLDLDEPKLNDMTKVTGIDC